jgi:hypothetical protein
MLSKMGSMATVLSSMRSEIDLPQYHLRQLFAQYGVSHTAYQARIYCMLCTATSGAASLFYAKAETKEASLCLP